MTAVPLPHRPHPVRGQGALPGLSGAPHRVTAPAPHPPGTRGGKFAAGSPRCLHAHLGLQESPGPLTCRPRSRTRTRARRLQDPSPPSRVWTSEAARATAPRRRGASRAPPLRAGPDPPEQRRPRASTEPGRSGGSGAAPTALRRGGSRVHCLRGGGGGGAAGAAGAPSAAGLGRGLGLGPGPGRGLGRHQAGRPAAGCARRHCARGGAARGERCHSCRPHHTPCPPRARWGPGARAPRRAQSGARGAEARSAGRRAGRGAQSRG